MDANLAIFFSMKSKFDLISRISSRIGPSSDVHNLFKIKAKLEKRRSTFTSERAIWKNRVQTLYRRGKCCFLRSQNFSTSSASSFGSGIDRSRTNDSISSCTLLVVLIFRVGRLFAFAFHSIKIKDSSGSSDVPGSGSQWSTAVTACYR